MRKEDWNLERNAKLNIAMTFHVPNHGNKLLQLEFRPSRLVSYMSS